MPVKKYNIKKYKVLVNGLCKQCYGQIKCDNCGFNNVDRVGDDCYKCYQNRCYVEEKQEKKEKKRELINSIKELNDIVDGGSDSDNDSGHYSDE